jgi:hypothetical protein
MRHFMGIVLAVVLAAAVFFAAGWGIARMAVATESFTTTNHASGKTLEALGALAATGLLAGILVAVRRVSPLAAGLPGIVLLAWSVLFAVNTSRAVRFVPMQHHSYGQGFIDLLGFGVTALAGAIFIIPLFIPSRWRYWASDDDYADVTTSLGLMR